VHPADPDRPGALPHGVCLMASTPHETYRAKIAVHTADGETATLIVTRQAGHREGPVWLTFGATFRATLALTDTEAGQLVTMIGAAKAARAG